MDLLCCVDRYVVDLKGSRARLISEMWRLQAQRWIDERTRAIFIEFSLFNPQVNLFVACTIVAEFSPDGTHGPGSGGCDRGSTAPCRVAHMVYRCT